ncbi:hypothetical protein F441_12353 [Phytophthora nicotianae CJ01A1]|uniref:Ataxin-2 C-terminal domain-containing protein n=6 Tax=Phytophthora nicotianae TaxID=4792 RepID=W2Q1N3_PHYN3|nr:hypothetical protein PPTG_13962 [Phytophthora nicotianae INRA-310]ETI42554.1 hypothetical protein F443_12368 [Phytophthora nicotianae P1569]ETK82576.1 hypothetical protein L915_12088 [Phytophthora nicotianae]ETO71147.1 hypothetical protein F444_12468 [Phytophthora nicotianae P1976]ETP12270.1 hypothetical protein F441_12353 [Phytophthora nicotianae CJ01A1]ETP40399.1 hypothetical protein F442_12285 [Phytophthora nicotianae P10297]KUF76050.1 hypothetical protein AM587_10011355 [Phytophthora n
MVSSPLPSSTLDALAPPFYPSMTWYPAITDDYYLERPHSPGKAGFVIADPVEPLAEIPDEELFDPAYYPLTATEMLELEQVDEINEILAELDLMESHQELHHKLTQKTRELRSSSDVDAEIYSMMAKAAKAKSFSSKQIHLQKKNSFHAKRNMRSALHQPRSVK